MARALPAMWGRSGATVSRLLFRFLPFMPVAAKVSKEPLLPDAAWCTNGGFRGRDSVATWCSKQV